MAVDRMDEKIEGWRIEMVPCSLPLEGGSTADGSLKKKLHEISNDSFKH